MQSHYNREAKRGQHLLGELLTLGLVYAGKTSYNKDKLEGGSSMRIPRRYWRNLDWPLIAAVLALIMIGMVVIYSASHSQLEASGLNPYHYVYRQLLALGMGGLRWLY